MFGPNTHIKSTSIISYSHRDNEFFDLYKDTVKRFKKVFDLNNYDILIIPGSGTVGIESIFWSLNKRISVIGHGGVFTKRWNKLSELYSNVKKYKPEIEKLWVTDVWSVTYEKGDYCYILKENIKLPADETIVLQADTEEHTRGLIVKWRSDGGYDVAYWYDDPSNIVPAELVGDGESFGDIKKVWL